MHFWDFVSLFCDLVFTSLLHLFFPAFVSVSVLLFVYIAVAVSYIVLWLNNSLLVPDFFLWISMTLFLFLWIYLTGYLFASASFSVLLCPWFCFVLTHHLCVSVCLCLVSGFMSFLFLRHYLCVPGSDSLSPSLCLWPWLPLCVSLFPSGPRYILILCLCIPDSLDRFPYHYVLPICLCSVCLLLCG